MSTYGDGSNGALNVTSGSHSLALNTKHQFTDVTIASGATLTTGSTTGSVLYILCTGTFTLNGTIDVSGKVSRGDNDWDVTLDGLLYTSPGVSNGASYVGTSANNSGYGSGGAGNGVTMNGTYYAGGGPSTGGASPTGGAMKQVIQGSNGQTGYAGSVGTQSGGGSGAAAAYALEGGVDITVVSNSGAGAGYYLDGDNGQSLLNIHGGSGSYTWESWGGGGGGLGGDAGRAGVHVVIKAKTLVLNGTIITKGTNGDNGGNGGRSDSNNGWTNWWGDPGLGGGGGNGGSISLVYSDSITDTATKIQTGGAGGACGYGGNGFIQYVSTGGTGGTGALTKDRVYIATGRASGGGSADLEFETGTYTITSGGSAIGRGIYATVYQALPQKEYELRVSQSNGDYVGTWRFVASKFGYSHKINQTPSELVVEIPRSPQNRVVSYDYLLDEGGNQILDSNSDSILVQTETENSVGPDTDVDVNYNVDVLAFYGGYEALQDENGEEILDENSSAILTQYGAPNGVKVYTGYIADYELSFGGNVGVRVVIVPKSTDMNHYIFKDGTSHTVAYLNTDPVIMAREGMDDYIAQGGSVTYDSLSMPLSGETADYEFKLQNTREVVDKTVELLPSGYYHFVHPGENKLYLLQKSATADHTFYYEKHITQLNLRKSITQLVNKVYFVGGDTGTSDLFTYTEDATSITNYRPGLKRLADSRVKLQASADALSQREIDTYKEPRYRTSLTITDAVYDIETIRLGEMVGFKNFGTFVDDLILQIVAVSVSDHSITMDLDMIVPDDTKRLIELKKSLMSEEVRNIGDIPT